MHKTTMPVRARRGLFGLLAAAFLFFIGATASQEPNHAVTAEAVGSVDRLLDPVSNASAEIDIGFRRLTSNYDMSYDVGGEVGFRGALADATTNSYSSILIWLTQNITLTSEIEISALQGVTIAGNGYGVSYDVDNRLGRCFSIVSGADVSFFNITISLGKPTSGGGGGIYISGSTMAMKNSTVHSNTIQLETSQGGGIYIDDSTVVLTDVTVSENEVQKYCSDCTLQGGGIYVTDSSDVTLNHCRVRYNYAWTSSGSTYYSMGQGAGIWVSGGTMRLNSCMLNNNKAQVWAPQGGALYAENGADVYLTTSTVADNIVNGYNNR